MSTSAGHLRPLLEWLGLGGSQGVGVQARLSAVRSKLMAPVMALAYRWYARQLMTEVRARPMPRHVAMILDGNRRFARRYGLSDVADGHRYGARKVQEVIEWGDQLHIPAITLWGLSVDNLHQRSPEELEKILQLFSEWLDEVCREYPKRKNRRQVRAVGRLDLLPEQLCNRIRDVERLTASDGPWCLNIAIAYGGREEIMDAFRRMLRERAARGENADDIAENFSLDDLQRYLYISDIPEPELIIRTSGEVRLSGFMLWQSVYSELYFCDALWPAFRKIDFLRAIRSFQARQRRFGR